MRVKSFFPSLPWHRQMQSVLALARQTCDFRPRYVCSSQHRNVDLSAASCPFYQDLCGNLCEQIIIVRVNHIEYDAVFIYNVMMFSLHLHSCLFDIGHKGLGCRRADLSRYIKAFLYKMMQQTSTSIRRRCAIGFEVEKCDYWCWLDTHGQSWAQSADREKATTSWLGETKVEHWWSRSDKILESAFSHGWVSFSGCLTALTLRQTPLFKHHILEVTLQSPRIAVENQAGT